MATNFPTSLDVLPNPTSTSKVNNATYDLKHSVQHGNVNDAVEALEAKVGINGSTVTTSHDYKLSGVTGADKAVSLTGTETLTNKSLTDSTTFIIDETDATKKAKFQASGITTGTTREITLPDANTTMAGTDATQTLTNKTIDGDNNTIQDLNAGTVFKTATAVPIANGGTGSTTATTGFNALSPSTTKGDIIVNNGTNDVRLAVGSNGTIPVADSTQSEGIKWALPSTLGLTKIYHATSFSSPVTITIPGNSLGTNNCIRVTLIGAEWTCNNDTVTITMSYGGTSLSALIVGEASSNSGTGGSRITAYLSANGSTSSQKFVCQSDFGMILTSSVSPQFKKVVSTLSINSTTNQDIVITKGGTGTITVEGVLVELIA